MRRHWRAIAALAAASPFLLYLALRLGLLTPLFNLALSQKLKTLSPVQVRVGALRSDVGSFIEADDVVVLAPVGEAKLPLLTIASLRLEYRAWSAWRGRIDWSEALSLARIKGLSVFLLREPGGRWNLSALAGLRNGKAKPGAKPGLPLLPASRVELEDSQVVLNDEIRGFHSSLDAVQGSLDTRALPLLVFTLSGRTEGKAREDLSLAGELDQRDGSFFGRLDLSSVPLARYLNYFLPATGLAFESGNASLSVRLRRDAEGELNAAGRAELADGSLRIPGIAEPLTHLQGTMAFDPASLRFRGVQARFLDSDWTVSGSIQDLRKPSFDVRLSNPAFPLQALSQQVRGLAPLAMTGTAMVEAGLSGPAAHPVVEALLHAPLMGLVGVELLGVSASARLQGAHLEVQRLQARLWGGHLDGHAAMGLAKGGRLEAAVELKGARLDQALLKGRRPLPLSGTAGLKLKASGLLREPQLDLDLLVDQASLGALQLGTLDLNAGYGPAGLRSRFSGASGRLSGSINFGRGKDAQFSASRVSLDGLDLAQLAHGLATAGDSIVLPKAGVEAGAWMEGRLAGSIHAALNFSGPLRSPTLWIDTRLENGRLLFRDPDVLRDKGGLPLFLRGEFGIGNGDLHLGREGQAFRLALNRRGKSVEVLALGRYPLHNGGKAKSGKLELALDGDLRALDAFSVFKETQGKLKGDVVLSGTPDSPLVDGDLSVHGFSSKPETVLAPIREGELRLQFRDQSAELTQLSFRAGGLVQAHGSLDLSGGFKDLQGSLELRTDADGLRLQNWEAMGSGSLVLDPLVLSVDGENQPIRVSGRARLSNALVTYAGRPKPAPDAKPAAPGRPWELDLRVGLGPNVWYEKHNSGVDLLDPSRWISTGLEAVQETFQRPDFFFRLRPTDQDIAIRRQDGATQLIGVLAIDRGRLSIMDNDFEIRPDLQVDARGARVSLGAAADDSGGAQLPSGSQALIHFTGHRADVYAVAVARLRYTRDDPITHRPQQRAANIIVTVRPLSQDQLERFGLADAFLNYSIDFSSEAPIEPDHIPAHRQAEAVLNLVVLGDPLVDLQQQSELAGGQDSASKITEAQINRFLSGEAKRQLAKWSKRGFKFLGTQLIDVLRVVPRVSYQGAGGGGATTASQASKQAQDQWAFNDFTVEIGKSLGEKLYASAQVVWFGEEGLSAVTSGTNAASQAVRDKGGRIGLEYQISPSRTAELYFSYSLDDNMQPLLYNPDDLSSARVIGARVRNTIPTDNYTPELARERRWDQELGVEP